MPPGTPRRATTSWRLVLAVLSLGTTGCYRTVPVESASLAPGATVRLYLTPQGTTQLAPRLGPETIAVDGRLESTGADGLAVVVSQTRKSFGGTIAWVGERVVIPAGLVAHAERRAIDRGRTLTVGVTTAVAAGAALVALIVQHGAGSGSDGTDGGGPTPSRAPHP